MRAMKAADAVGKRFRVVKPDKRNVDARDYTGMIGECIEIGPGYVNLKIENCPACGDHCCGAEFAWRELELVEDGK